MKFNFNGKEYYIDATMASQLNSIVYNIKDDWDFVILITGDRTVRVGKSVIAMTVCAYLANVIQLQGLNPSPYTLKDIYFDNKKMMEAAKQKPKYSINHYDEGREGLAANKAMFSLQKDLLDFFAECGQLNQIFVIVMPDFFKMQEEIAVPRSEFLINVYRKETAKMIDFFKTGEKIPITSLDRGYFEFFSRKKKQLLYDISQSTKRKYYSIVKADFIGRFTHQYPLDEVEYRKMKTDALVKVTEPKIDGRVMRKYNNLKEAMKIIVDGIPRAMIREIAKKNGCSPQLLHSRIYAIMDDDKEAIEIINEKLLDVVKPIENPPTIPTGV